MASKTSDPSGSTPSGFALWVAGARPKTLPAAVVPVLVGTAAVADGELGGGGGIVWWRFVAAMVVSLALQVGVNFANDYSDGVKGTDDERVGPLRLVGSGLASPSAVKRAALGAFAVAGVAGLALTAATTWWLLAVGVASVLAAWGYTGGPKPYGYLGLGEVFVFVFFGLVATVGSAYVQTEEIDGLATVAAVPVGLLATALLVINNLRDIPTDAVTGKQTLAVRLGDAATRWLYQAMIVAVFVLIAVLAAVWRVEALLGLLAMPLAIPPLRTVASDAVGLALIPVLGATGRLQLATGALLSAGLWWGA